MDDISFFSSNRYLYLPTAINPKVALAIDNAALSKNAFKLLNPFSVKGIVFKVTLQFLFSSLNSFAKIFIKTKQQRKSEFIKYLESKLNISLVSSIYFSTSNDKVVLQLQSGDKIIGYLKYPLNDNGIRHIKAEEKAIKILSEKQIIEPYLLYDHYNGSPYLLIKELIGEFKDVKKEDLNVLLDKLKTGNKYLLKEHSRILELKSSLNNYKLDNYLSILDSVCDLSNELYYEVFEHGDFAPWNIISSSHHVTIFDFEYFEENGLEYLDLIKYHYQIESLLQGTSKDSLIKTVINKIDCPEANLLFQVFLIKEIIRKKQESESYFFEHDLLMRIWNEYE